MWNWALTIRSAVYPANLDGEGWQRDITASISHGSRCVPGEGRRLDLDGRSGRARPRRPAVLGPWRTVDARLDLSRTAAGYAIRVRFVAHVDGPCMRCLDDADVAVEVDAREVDQPRTADEELTSPYIADDELDLGALGPRRAGARAADPAPLPARLRGTLSGVRRVPQRRRPGRARATEAEPDPRWAKLRELKLDQ